MAQSYMFFLTNILQSIFIFEKVWFIEICSNGSVPFRQLISAFADDVDQIIGSADARTFIY